MNLGTLKNAPGAVRKNKRIGRGSASGQGCTAGRGNKGQRSRSGSKRRPWFEGGQMPLQRRLPKYGFYQHGKVHFQVINVGDLIKLENVAEVTMDVLKESGLIKYADRPVKLLANGDLDKKINIKVNAVSASAREKIEKVGGTVTLL